MGAHLKAESGLQLLARLTGYTRPNISEIDTSLFPSGTLDAYHVIELLAGSGSGKTLLATHLIARCILSREFGGMGAEAILINTDHHFQIVALVSMLEYFLRNGRCKSIRKDVNVCLQRLKILACFDSTQLRITLHALAKYLSTQKQVSLVVCDSPAAFYWPDQLGTDRMTTKHKYLSNILSAIYSGLFHHNVILVYTVSDSFISPTFTPPVRHLDSKHHRVYLKMLYPRKTIAEGCSSTTDREGPILYDVTVISPDLPEHRVHFRVNSKGIPLFIKNSNISTEKR